MVYPEGFFRFLGYRQCQFCFLFAIDCCKLYVNFFWGVRWSFASVTCPLLDKPLVLSLLATGFGTFEVECSLTVGTVDSFVGVSEGLPAFFASCVFSIRASVADERNIFLCFSCLVQTKHTISSFCDVVRSFTGPALELILLDSFLAPRAHNLTWDGHLGP